MSMSIAIARLALFIFLAAPRQANRSFDCQETVEKQPIDRSTDRRILKGLGKGSTDEPTNTLRNKVSKVGTSNYIM